MVSGRIYLEGGGDSKDGRIRCREGFSKLLENCRLGGRMPKLTACGSRNAAYDDFETGHRKSTGTNYVGLLVDSEVLVSDISLPWDHLFQFDGWPKPPGASDDQALLMVTCMETWIVADRKALEEQFGRHLRISALPPLDGLENRPREAIQDGLRLATSDCPAPFAKGPKSFEVLGKLDPDTMAPRLPSFVRALGILGSRL